MRPLWFLTKDGDRTLLALYERHYSCYQYADGRPRFLFVGPGEKVVLRTNSGDAGFAWRKFIDDSGQQGVNCAFFRNESSHTSSELIRQADAIADRIWPSERHYTYVDPTKTRRKRDPGRCFVRAGWRRCGLTAKGLVILEKLPEVKQMADIKWNHLKQPERKRTYHFPGGDVLTFENVIRVEVRDSGKHRIETADGRKAFVSTGWLWMEIETPEWSF